MLIGILLVVLVATICALLNQFLGVVDFMLDRANVLTSFLIKIRALNLLNAIKHRTVACSACESVHIAYSDNLGGEASHSVSSRHDSLSSQSDASTSRIDSRS